MPNSIYRLTTLLGGEYPGVNRFYPRGGVHGDKSPHKKGTPENYKIFQGPYLFFHYTDFGHYFQLGSALPLKYSFEFFHFCKCISSI